MLLKTTIWRHQHELWWPTVINEMLKIEPIKSILTCWIQHLKFHRKSTSGTLWDSLTLIHTANNFARDNLIGSSKVHSDVTLYGMSSDFYISNIRIPEWIKNLVLIRLTVLWFEMVLHFLIQKVLHILWSAISFSL